MYMHVQRFGSISFLRGSGSWDPHLGKVDPDPRIHLYVIVDPAPHLEIVDSDPGPKLIRIRAPIFNIFIKKFMSDKLQYLFLLPPKFRKRNFSDNKNIREIEVDPDSDPERGLN